MLRKDSETARGVMGDKLHFVAEMWNDVAFRGKMCKVKIFVAENATNLFGTD